jgi:hypothetical protein
VESKIGGRGWRTGAALEKRSAGGQTPVVGPKLFQAALDGPKPWFVAGFLTAGFKYFLSWP